MASDKNSRRTFVRSVVTTSVGLSVAPAAIGRENKSATKAAKADASSPEWRNHQSGMSYRMFGDTGMMVSEIVMGTTPWKDDSYVKIIEACRESGINYIDTAPAYSKGNAEKVIGKYLKESGNRDNLFLSTKISFYDEFMRTLVEDVLSGLPFEKKADLEKRAVSMIEERGVLKPGYHFKYFKGQDNKFKTAYMRHLVLKEYGVRKEWKPKIKARMHELVENSLRALQTDHLDVLHCPHGVAMPEMLDDENIREVFDDLKKKGSVRFAALSMHNDVAANLDKAIELGHYDGAMVAYNVGNHASLERSLLKAKQAGMGIVAMKVARAVSNPGMKTPQWCIQKLNEVIPEKMSIHSKAYLWALQNQNISCCVSEMPTPEAVADNVAATGRKVSTGMV